MFRQQNSTHILFCLWYNFSYWIFSANTKEKGCYYVSKELSFEKCGTVTISVYKDENKLTCFLIQSDNDEVSNVVEIVEDTLCMY